MFTQRVVVLLGAGIVAAAVVYVIMQQYDLKKKIEKKRAPPLVKITPEDITNALGETKFAEHDNVKKGFDDLIEKMTHQFTDVYQKMEGAVTSGRANQEETFTTLRTEQQNEAKALRDLVVSLRGRIDVLEKQVAAFHAAQANQADPVIETETEPEQPEEPETLDTGGDDDMEVID